MTLSPEREAEVQDGRLDASAKMTPAEIVTLQDDLAWWKDHAAKLSADNFKLATAMMKGPANAPPTL